jgi:lysophospholipid acyltransferase (LPLAT)-like uncharacterized protein
MAKLRQTTWAYALARRIYAAYIGLVFRTTRWRHVGFEGYEADIAAGRPRVLCTWHDRLALTPFCRDWTGHPLAVLASDHRDAQVMTSSLLRRGITVVPLKTTGDNSAAMRQAVRLLRAGTSIGVTPDGPLGPRHVVKPGALILASLAQARVAPLTYSVSRRRVLKTWDRLVLPLPFGRGVFAMAEGFVPPPRMDAAQMQAAQERLGRMMDELTEAADRMVDTGQ